MISFISSLKPQKAEHWIVLCLFLYAFGHVLSYYSVDIGKVLRISSASLFIILLIFAPKKFPFSNFSSLVYCLLLIWLIWLSFYSFLIETSYLERQGFGPIIILTSPQFIPNLWPFALFLISHHKIIDFRYLFRYSYVLCACFLLYYPFAFYNMINYSWSDISLTGEWGEEGTYGDFITNSTLGIGSLGIPAFFIYMKPFVTKRVWIMYVVTFTLSMVLSLFMGRRGNIFIALLHIFSCWTLMIISTKSFSKIKIVIVGCFMFFLMSLIFSNLSDSFFSTLVSRMGEDSRSGVEESFYMDMKYDDWIYGRGFFGMYFDPLFKQYRAGIETGYLTIILRGGLIYLILYVTVIMYSACVGIIKSNNIFVKAFAFVMIISVIELYPYGWFSFSIKNWLLWIGVFVCNSSYYRSLSDMEIRSKYFRNI